MISVFRKTFYIYPTFVLMIFVNLGISQKGGSPHRDLEINNLRKQKPILFFNTQERLNPNLKKNLRHATEITSPDVIKSKAESYLRQNKSKFGIINVKNDLRFESISKSPAGNHLRYQEFIDGIPVYDARISISLNKNGEVSFVNGKYRSNRNLPNMQPAILPQLATELAREYLKVTGELRGDQDAELYIFDSKDKGLRLTYRVRIPCTEPFGDWEVFVDAQVGDIVHADNHLISKTGTDGTGMIWNPDPLTSGGVYYGGDFKDHDDNDTLALNDQRISVTLKDLYTDGNGLYVLEGPHVKLSDRDSPSDSFPHLVSPDSFNYSRADQNFEAVMVYYHIDESYRRLLDLGFFQEDSVEGLLEFEADPHGYSGLDNSYYSPFLNYCAFGEGGVDDAEDAAVIWHEYAHALQYNISDVSYSSGGETFSLLEGCSDYWAASYSRRINAFGWNHVFLWDAGISSAEGDTTFWAGRRCDLDWKYSRDDSLEYAGTHIWGQIWSSALMRIWADLGPDITDKLFITSHYYWGTHPDFNSAAEAFIQADLDLNSGVNLPVIIQWFDYHALIDRSAYRPQISHNPNDDIEAMEEHYKITCKIVPANATLDSTDLWLFWSLDSIFADSSLLIDGIGDSVFSADIPGVTEPSTITYYFSAKDSLNLYATDPLDAPLDYYSFYAGPDSLPPSPLNLEITNYVNVIDLVWEQVITGKYVSYNIYKSDDGENYTIKESTSSSTVTDTSVFVGNQYYYYVTTVFDQWESNPSDTVEAIVEAITSVANVDKLPTTYRLRQNYPNPFNPRTIINYELPTTNEVELIIYNLLGQTMVTLVSERQDAGFHQVEWDASGLASGVYYYMIKAGKFQNIKKMILLK